MTDFENLDAIDYARMEINHVTNEAKALAVGALMRGQTHEEIVTRIDRYLLEHWKLDPARWVWRVFTPWRQNVLTVWSHKDVRVVIEPRSAVEQLARLGEQLARMGE